MAKKSNANIGFEKEVVYAIYIENYLIPDQSYLINFDNFSDILAWHRNGVVVYRYDVAYLEHQLLSIKEKSEQAYQD